MLKRTLTGALLTLIVLLGFFLRQIVDYRIFDIVILIVALLASIEFNTALKDRTSKAQKILSVIFTITVFIVAVFFKKSLFTFVVVYVSCALIYSSLFEHSKSVDKMAYFAFSLFYPTIPTLFMSLVNQMGEFSLFALVIMLVTSSSTDIFAYLVGSKVKGKKLCEKISPNKTVSGAIGGFVGGTLSGVIVYVIFKECGASPFVSASPLSALLFIIISSMLFSIVTQVGDLFESSVKRGLNIKDMGGLLPGHGGMLDRIDGLMFNAVAVYLCYALLV